MFSKRKKGKTISVSEETLELEEEKIVPSCVEVDSDKRITEQETEEITIEAFNPESRKINEKRRSQKWGETRIDERELPIDSFLNEKELRNESEKGEKAPEAFQVELNEIKELKDDVTKYQNESRNAFKELLAMAHAGGGEKFAQSNSDMKNDIELIKEEMTQGFNKISRLKDVNESLHKELQMYKEGVFFQLQLPILKALMNILETMKYDQNHGNSQLVDYIEELEDVLDFYNVQMIESQVGEEVISKLVKVMDKLGTTDPTKHRTIAKIRNDGYVYEDIVIKKQEVDVYVLTEE